MGSQRSVQDEVERNRGLQSPDHGTIPITQLEGDQKTISWKQSSPYTRAILPERQGRVKDGKSDSRSVKGASI